MFQWLPFLELHGIVHGPSGANNVTIACPWCDPEAAHQHLAINLHGRGWHCWKQPQHRGVSPVRLIVALLRCSTEQAARIAEVPTSLPPDFLASVRGRLHPPPRPVREAVDCPREFKPLVDKPSARPYLNYLRRRGFAKPLQLGERYELYYATTGEYASRIIFPVRYQQQLMTWTGRSIGTDPLRYKTLAAASPLDYLLWFDHLQTTNADSICLTEGPFDALKVNALGAAIGVVATCFFTAAPSNRQVDLLHTVLPRFRQRYLLLDQGTFATAIGTQSRLTGLNVVVRQLPPQLKDPGVIATTKQLLAILGAMRYG